jgi:hypothetical protein
LTTIEVPLAGLLVFLAAGSAHRFEAKLNADLAAKAEAARRAATLRPKAFPRTNETEAASAPWVQPSPLSPAVDPDAAPLAGPPATSGPVTSRRPTGRGGGGAASVPPPMQTGYQLPKQRVPVQFLTPGVFTPIAIPVDE